MIILLTKEVLVTQIEEVQSELGEPDCKLTEPFAINDDGTLSPWLLNLTTQNGLQFSKR